MRSILLYLYKDQCLNLRQDMLNRGMMPQGEYE
jgi:hypothetical protein